GRLHRLMPVRRQLHDRESPKSEPDTRLRIDPDPVIVRAAMDERSRHPGRQRFQLLPGAALRGQNARKTAHVRTSRTLTHCAGPADARPAPRSAQAPGTHRLPSSAATRLFLSLSGWRTAPPRRCTSRAHAQASIRRLLAGSTRRFVALLQHPKSLQRHHSRGSRRVRRDLDFARARAAVGGMQVARGERAPEPDQGSGQEDQSRQMTRGNARPGETGPRSVHAVISLWADRTPDADAIGAPGRAMLSYAAL